MGETDPARALQRAIDAEPDLILLYIGLPGIDGFEVCRLLKEHPVTRHVPVIFLTGTSDIEAKVRGLDLGAVDFITKPFDQVELRARVRAALRTKRLQDMLEQQSFLDGLTGLWNRKFLDKRLEIELSVARRYGRALSLTLADIDRFKQLNDTHGHLFGDIVLQGIADALRGYARGSDVVARYGGEEFAILLTDTPTAAALQVTERLRVAVEAQSFELRGRRISVTASFGVACSEDLGGELTPEAMFSAADRALYASKDAGRNCIHVSRGGEPQRT
jgi:diguanylate cyclase (GGDEF)-like protein